MHSPLSATVVISTYNQPDWLKLVLHSYDIQTTGNFEIIIADDGSDEATRRVIEDFKKSTSLKIIHL